VLLRVGMPFLELTFVRRHCIIYILCTLGSRMTHVRGQKSEGHTEGVVVVPVIELALHILTPEDGSSPKCLPL
jgi:hypothetical protein